MTLLPIQNDHIRYLSTFPVRGNHRDPFDRLLLSTAVVQNLTLVSVDGKFGLYDDLVEIVCN